MDGTMDLTFSDGLEYTFIQGTILTFVPQPLPHILGAQ